MYGERNFKEHIPTQPSYSLMHSLEGGFSILMYSGTHRLNLGPDMCLHKYNAVRIILSEWMATIWYESLFYAEAKFRDILQDMRFFHTYG